MAHPSARRAEQPRRVLLQGLAAFWLLDGLLQMQPGMFTMDILSTVMQPAATGQPAWLSALIGWSVRLVAPRIVAFNWGIVALQLGIGALLLLPRRRLVAAGLWLSLVWALVVWLFGEGLGQLLTGSASFLTGAPGSACLYAVASVLLLLPEERCSWWRGRRVDAATGTVALLLVLGALLQTAPVFWTPLGIAAPFGSGQMMPQPLFVRSTLVAAANLVAVAPVPANLLICAAMLGLGVLLWRRPDRRPVYVAGFIWLAAVWWFGQDFGMLWSGMATDPNSAPVAALLLLAGWSAQRAGSARWR